MSQFFERQIQLSELAYRSFRFTPPAGTTISDILNPTNWVMIARSITPFDLIDVVPEDGSFYARLFVLNSDKVRVVLHLLEHVELLVRPKAETAASDLYDVTFSGPVAKWRVVKKNGGDAVSESFQTRADAEDWFKDNSRDLVA